MKKICMIVQDKMVKGGIAAVISGYYGSEIEKKYDVTYVESYIDGSKVQKLFKSICGYVSFIKKLILNRPDLVHIHSSFGPSFYRKLPFIYLANMAGVPIINHIHGADFNAFYEDASQRKKRLIQKTYNKCDRLIALSQEWKERLSKIVPENKIVVIENYSILNNEAYMEKQNKTTDNVILFLGEIGKRKGCYDIPNVAAIVKQSIPNVKFVLCGEGSKNDENAIKGKISELGLEDNFVFPGWVRNQQKDSWLRKADIFFLPSYNEGMPMSVLDAMGYGLPIVSTNVGGIPKIVHNDKNGYCCTPGDIAGMSKSIISLLSDNIFRKKCGKESYEIIESTYSLNRHISLLLDLYKEVIK